MHFREIEAMLAFSEVFDISVELFIMYCTTSDKTLYKLSSDRTLLLLVYRAEIHKNQAVLLRDAIFL